MGRGGDHIPFLERGLPAIRISVAVEDYQHQHQDLRTENGIEYGDTVDRMDFPYLARITRLNVAAMDRLARAPMPPQIQFDGLVRADVLLAMSQEACVKYSGILRDGGRLIIDTMLVTDCQVPKAEILALPITKTAKEKLGNAMFANIIALGALVGGVSCPDLRGGGGRALVLAELRGVHRMGLFQTPGGRLAGWRTT